MEKESILRELTKRLENLKDNDVLKKINDTITENIKSLGYKENDFLVYARYKQVSSIEEKIHRKGYTDPDQMTDLMGVKIVTARIEDIAKIEETLKEVFNTASRTDYYSNLRLDGYQSLHLDLTDPEGVFNFEMQIKDISNELKQKYCHSKIYKSDIDMAIKNAINLEMNKYLDIYLSQKDLSVHDGLNSEEINHLDKQLMEYAESIKERDLDNDGIPDRIDIDDNRNSVQDVKDLGEVANNTDRTQKQVEQSRGSKGFNLAVLQDKQKEINQEEHKPTQQKTKNKSL